MNNEPCKQECHNCKDFMYFGTGESGMGKCVFGRDTKTRQYPTTKTDETTLIKNVLDKHFKE